MRRGGRYIKDIVYGANDGIITTFAIVAGVAGANLATATIVLLGAANIIADGFSMALSNYLGSKSERDFIKKEAQKEAEEIEATPDQEEREMYQLLKEHGYGETDAKLLCGLLFKNKKFFTDLMVQEELDVPDHHDERLSRGALITFFSFVIAGFIPILPFLVFPEIQNLFLYSIVSTALILFLVGSLRAFITERSWFLSGFEMLFVGGLAALIAYTIGFFLKTFGVA